MFRRLSLLPLAALALSAPLAAQQQSQSYKFLEAVRKGDNNTVISMLDQPGQTIINTRDVSTGEGALHIAAKRGDALYVRYLLGKGADVNARDGHGDSAMMLAVDAGQPEIVAALAAARANANLANASGETPLIHAVQRRDLGLVRAVLAAGGNPDQTDNAAGLSARDYAKRDMRSAAIVKLFDDTPRTKPRAVSGPRL